METRQSPRRVPWPATTLVVALCIAAIAPGCAPARGHGDRTVVAVTLLPQAAFVEKVAGGLADVVVMVPPGGSPHTYEVTPEQMVSLATAKMYAKVGTPVEFELTWMDRLIAANREMLVVDCAQGIELIESGETAYEDKQNDVNADEDHVHAGADPHIWLSVRNAQMMVENICDGLVQVDPANADVYLANRDRYVEELSSLDAELAAVFQRLEQRRFIAFHPSFGYLARDYGLTQIAVEQGGTEPDAQYLIRLIEEAKLHEIRMVFVSPQFSTKSAEVVAREIDGEVVIVDPLARDYITNMRAIAEAIGQAS